MKTTRTVLLAFLWGTLTVAVIIVALFELGILEVGAGHDNPGGEYAASVVAELLALCLIPLALWLFKAKKVNSDLKNNKAKALKKWGLLRMGMLCVPLIADIVLYYLFVSPTFAYLAIIHAICLLFIYPTAQRCAAETEPSNQQ